MKPGADEGRVRPIRPRMTAPTLPALTDRRLDGKDGAALLSLLALLAWLLLFAFDRSAPPYEDAAILMRYSDHLAQGHGIVWNVGGEPVDGATDFLFMVALAGVRWLGPSIEDAARWIGVVCHVLTCLVVYLGVRRLHGAPRWTALLSASYLALGPGLAYVEAGFGTPSFGLVAATTWYLAVRAYRGERSLSNAVWFSLSALALGLVRPEGVFLGLFMLAGLLLFQGWRPHRRLVGTYVLVFGLPGLAYFLWRWSYFGHPLPNPYYIKGRGHVFPKHVVHGTVDLIQLAAPFVPIFLYAAALAVWRWRGERVERSSERPPVGGPAEVAFSFFPPVAFTILSMLHEGLMDYVMRFQYCNLPILLMSWPAFLMGILHVWRFPAPLDRARRPLGVLLVAVFFLVALGYARKSFDIATPHRWGTLDVAHILADYPGDHTVAVTNAGQIPLVSGWDAIDVWGLNDHSIAIDGLTPEFLDRSRPEVIQFDAGFTPLTKGDMETPLPWHKAMKVLEEYAESRGYVLAACFGRSPFGGHYYYVRPDFPESEEIVRRIRALDYRLLSGSCFDFGIFHPQRRGEGRAG